ncbi:MAG TPA: hypothetical protein VKE24_16170 [Candidatus Acidoferrales bacterium]|nr:hypothetical protein [Candidatus Acidoferrales bacterium]
MQARKSGDSKADELFLQEAKAAGAEMYAQIQDRWFFQVPDTEAGRAFEKRVLEDPLRSLQGSHT